MSQYKPYAAYKDSGIGWLGRVPEHWTVCKVSFRYSIELGKMLDEKSLTNTNLVPYLRNQDVQWGKINALDLPEMDIRPDELDRYTVRGGDLLVCEGGDVGRAAIWYGEDAVCGYQKALHRLRRRSEFKDLADYFYFSLVAAKQRGVFEESDSKATIAHLPADKFRQYRFAFAPLSEQISIAKSLERKACYIDALIERKARFIELLREKRQALITHAVTKGLNPSAKMKESGVQWLGEVPGYWTVAPLKRLISSIGQGWSPECEARVPDGSEWGVLKVGCVNGGVFRSNESKVLPTDMAPRPELSLKAGDVLVSRANTRELVGSCAVVQRDYPHLMLCDKLYRIGAGEQVLPEFLAALINVHGRRAVEVEATGASSSMVNIAQSVILDLVVALPGRDEQREIIDRVAIEVARIESLQEKTERSIALLKERRAALITAAVTGQIDLREVA